MSAASDPFAEKIAIVTGASSGIGRATALALAAAGARVALLARRRERLTALAAELPAGAALPLTCDMTDESQVAQAFAAVTETWGGYDLVVSNAGAVRNAPIEDTTLEIWEAMQAVLARGYFLAAREAFRWWKTHPDPAADRNLVFVSSKNAVVAAPGVSAYAAAKAAALHLARCLAEEGGPAGIRVNSVLPDGVIAGTEILSPQERLKAAARHGLDPSELEAYYMSRNTLKRQVRPQDVAAAILFLAGPGASRLTGVALTVDGGLPAAYLR